MRSPRSYSAFSLVNRCPAAYRLAYLDGDPGVTPPALKNGADTHDAIARYAAHCYRKQRTSDMEEGRTIALGYPEPVRGLVEQFVENWRWEWGSSIVEGVLPVEQEFTAALPGGQEFSGHLDLLQMYEGASSVVEMPFGMDDTEDGDGALWVITDFKSGLYGDVWDEDVAPKQLQWYAWLVQQNFPKARAFELRLYAIRTNYTLSWRMGGDLSYIGHELQAIADRIAAETEWEACPGEACVSCLHVHACPLRETETVKQIAHTEPDDMLAYLLWHTAQADALKPLLKARAELDGPIHTGGYVYEGRRSTSLVPLDRATFRQDCETLGVEYETLTGDLQKSLLQKAAKKLEEGKRNTFLGLLEEVPKGGPVYKAYQDKAGDPGEEGETDGED